MINSQTSESTRLQISKLSFRPLFCIFLLICFTLSSQASNLSSSQEHRLVGSLFDGYVRTIRPVKHRTNPTHVSLRLLLYQLINVNVIEQSLDALYWFEMNWQDEFLQWNPKEFDNITWIIADKEIIWKPDITAYEQTSLQNVQDLRNLISDPKLEYTGLITVMEPKLLQTSCIMNVYYFPFDTQRCQITYGSWAFGTSEIYTKLGQDAANLDNYQANPNWDLLGYEAEEVVHEFTDIDSSFSFANFRIIIRRQPRSVICTVILPVFLVSALSILNFMIPCETGEKMGFGITLFLALCFNLTVIAGMMPQIGIYVPLISQYCILAIILVAMSLVGTMVVLKVHHNPLSIDPPQWAVRWLVVKFGTWLSVKSAKEWCASHKDYLANREAAGKKRTMRQRASYRQTSGLDSEVPHTAPEYEFPKRASPADKDCQDLRYDESGEAICRQSNATPNCNNGNSWDLAKMRCQAYQSVHLCDSNHEPRHPLNLKPANDDLDSRGGSVYVNSCHIPTKKSSLLGLPEFTVPTFEFTNDGDNNNTTDCIDRSAPPTPIVTFSSPVNHVGSMLSANHTNNSADGVRNFSPGIITTRRPSFFASRVTRRDAIQAIDLHELSSLAPFGLARMESLATPGSGTQRLSSIVDPGFMDAAGELSKFEPVWAVMADVLDRILCVTFGCIFSLIILIFSILLSLNPNT